MSSVGTFVVAMGVALVAAGCWGPAHAEPSQTGQAAVAAAIAAQPAAASGMLKPDAGTALAPEKSADPSIAVAAPPPPPAPPTLLIDIDLTKQRMTVTDNGRLKHTWPISSGREGYRTPTGTFRPQWMAKMWYSKQYDDAPMPHSIFFKGGVAVHATYATRMLGRPASHGCIRLAPANAAALYALVNSHGKSLTRIKVFGTAQDGVPVASKRRDLETAGRTRSVQPNGYSSERSARQASERLYPAPRYSYNRYSGGSGHFTPRYIYPGDAPYGYRPARSPYRPYGDGRY